MTSSPSRSAAASTQRHGLVVVDKPKGMTSHDVVAKIRRIAGTRKVGHAGTLDPMATGVLVVGINKATRLLTFIVGTNKQYEATLRLGQTTHTDDAESEILRERVAAAVTEENFRAVAKEFTGRISQVPSSVSAIKVNGKRAYDLVRAGQDVQLQAREVNIEEMEILDFRKAKDAKTIDVDVRVTCSSGTYIRALARDIGEKLGVGAHLTALRRTYVGPYRLDQARTLEELAENCSVLDLDEAAKALLPNRQLTAEESVEVSFGRKISADEKIGPIAALDPQGEVVAILENTEDTVKSLVVFKPGESRASLEKDAPHV